MPLRQRIAILLFTLALGTTNGVSQSPSADRPDFGTDVYRRVADSVFLVEVSDGTTITATGTAFVTGDQLLVTNAHVVSAGMVSIRVAGITLPCEVLRRDPVNDLALLKVSAGSGWPPLKVNDVLPAVGSTLYTIGNPRGLERTISQGLFSGLRDMNGRQLLQLTAPISAGSSGSPVVNASGDVVGVIVGTLTSGQNLNFAVPSAVLTSFLTGSTSSHSLDTLISAIQALQRQQSEVGWEDPKWKELQNEINVLLPQMLTAATSGESLLKAADVLLTESNDLAIKAAREADQKLKGGSIKAKRIIASALARKAWMADSNEALALRREAVGLASLVAKTEPTADNLSMLAGIQQNIPGDESSAFANYRRVADIQRKSHGGIDANTLYNLFSVAKTLKHTIDARNAFEELQRGHKVFPYQWREYARFLDDLNEDSSAGDAWLRAGNATNLYSDWCNAAGALSRGKRDDDALAAARTCIEKGTGQNNSESDIAFANRLLSIILNERGVYDQAITHARQAIVLDSTDAFAQEQLAKALNLLQRYSEAEVAAKAAIRLSDGKHYSMHFELGNAYFEQKNWTAAGQAYQKAAELNPQSSSAAFNVAVSFFNARFYSDALKWYREALRRNPSSANREEILKQISKLEAMK